MKVIYNILKCALICICLHGFWSFSSLASNPADELELFGQKHRRWVNRGRNQASQPLKGKKDNHQEELRRIKKDLMTRLLSVSQEILEQKISENHFTPTQRNVETLLTYDLQQLKSILTYEEERTKIILSILKQRNIFIDIKEQEEQIHFQVLLREQMENACKFYQKKFEMYKTRCEEQEKRIQSQMMRILKTEASKLLSNVHTKMLEVEVDNLREEIKSKEKIIEEHDKSNCLLQ
ncbi:hypothetical protein IM40_10705 (plasmid) [Candidatus Paracaedimonas acanthamoebae]|nr:hypothetical protein IM40_10210 [Candidatus Paracaedimonas acanthamoebae]AIL13835.1 hypothetical protein IM40_10705 [Candidatus Paracaedimonas acanthamoebae]